LILAIAFVLGLRRHPKRGPEDGMKNDWILEVLQDLGQFADANGLPELSRQLRDVYISAEAEIASAKSGLAAATAGRLSPY
jgi:hypothetical protein